MATTRRLRLLFALLLFLFGPGDSLKFLAYNPIFRTSHATFLGAVSKALVEAGHEVVMIAPEMEPRIRHTPTPGVRLVHIDSDPEVQEFMFDLYNKTINIWWSSSGDMDFLKAMIGLTNACLMQCKRTLSQPGLIAMLREEKFDAAFGEPFDNCGFAIFHLAGIESIGMILSIPTLSGTFDVTGAPAMTSYVPAGANSVGERMTFFERLQNTLASEVFLYGYFAYKNPKYSAIFEEIQPGFPSNEEIFRKSSLVFVNANPLIDFPRPTTHKIIEIGGITVANLTGTLDEYWNGILSLRPRTILLSFGSSAQSFMMPEEYKKALKEAFGRLKDTTVIWKYERPEDKIGDGIEHIVESTWVPQRELLSEFMVYGKIKGISEDSRLTLFMTHGGAGSMMESLHSGVPLIVVPLMGDQMRNAALIEHLGSGIRIYKESLAEPDVIFDRINKAIEHPKYNDKAKKIAAMLKDQPFGPKEKFVKNMEFLGKYGPLRQLDHYGTQLYWWQYYLVDVALFILSILFVIIFIKVKIVMCLFRCCRAARLHQKKGFEPVKTD